MNKLAKGSIAAAAGLALLTGGAGTFALWNTSASVSAQHITAGSLSLVSNTDGVWKSGATVVDPATYRIVPGTTLVYTQTLTVKAVGDGLVGDLGFSGLDKGTTGLAPYVSTSVATTSSTATTVGGKLRFTPGTSTVTATVTVNFTDAGDTSGTASMNQALDLSQGAFVLTQVAG
jgi:alternate signal-mediated exported protein